MADHPKILYLGGTHDQEVTVRERLADDFDIVETLEKNTDSTFRIEKDTYLFDNFQVLAAKRLA